MTNVHLSGILAQKFGKLFKFNLSNASDCIRAIDANRRNFIIELKKLSKNGYEYLLIVDGEIIKNNLELLERKNIKNIYFLPLICGAGPALAVALGLAVSVTSTSAIVWGAILTTVISSIVSLGVSLLMQSLNKQGAAPQVHISVGGMASTIEAQGKSYIFSNNQNVIAQGSSIPVGYGRMKANSNVISISVKSYPTNYTYQQEITNSNYTIFNDFLSN